MTLDDMEKALWGLGTAAVAGLIALVRGGDVKRLDTMEQRHDALESAVQNARERTHDEIQSLRKRMDENHAQVISILLERKS